MATTHSKKNKQSYLLLKSDAFEEALSANLNSFTSPPLPLKKQDIDIVGIGESHGSHFLCLSKEDLPGTGCILIRSPKDGDILVDPGWGAFSSSRRNDIDLSNVRFLLVSHSHFDQIGDLSTILIYLSLKGVKPILIGNSTTILGSEDQPPVISDYLKNLCKSVIVAGQSDTHKLSESILIQTFPSLHKETKVTQCASLGFIVSIQSEKNRFIKIGILTDGPFSLEYSHIEELRRCEVLVVNIGTLSASPQSPYHDNRFNNATCFHGMEHILNTLYCENIALKQLILTQFGAEILETRAKEMKQLLGDTIFATPIDMLKSAMEYVVEEIFETPILISLLRDGVVCRID